MSTDESAQQFNLSIQNVTIGVLTALREEYVACKQIFDPDSRGRAQILRATSGSFECWLCAVPSIDGGYHVVAISRLPDMGNVAAAIGANILLQHCANTIYLIMCGIAGAVPNPLRPSDHVRLGDIVVCNQAGIFRYDRGKQHDPRRSPRSGWRRVTTFLSAFFGVDSVDPFAAFDFRGPPRAPHRDLLEAVERIHTDELMLGRQHERKWEAAISAFLSRTENAEDWKRPSNAQDILIDSPSLKAPPIPHPDDSQFRRPGHPRVFHGPIAAADVVQADPRRRDYLRDRHAVKAIEMESSGIADACWVAGIGYLVVRGTCDYCNSRKNDHWHYYAALAAAAYTRTVVEYLYSIVAQPGVDETVQNELSQAGYRSALLATVQGSDTAAHLPPAGMSASQPESARQISPESIDDNSPPGRVDHGGLGATIDEIEGKIRELRWSDIPMLTAALEQQLTDLPRRGTEVRRGWILLARLETKALHEQGLAGRPVDLTRLRLLRQEAESVTE